MPRTPKMPSGEGVDETQSKITKKNVHPNTLAALRPWKPGQSGNPAGRPRSTGEMKQKFATLTDLAFEITEAKARLQMMRLERAIDVLADEQASAEDLTAAVAVIEGTSMETVNAILDRAHGKPQQKVEVDHRTVFEELNPDEFDAWLVETGQKVTTLMKARRQKAIENGQRIEQTRANSPRKT